MNRIISAKRNSIFKNDSPSFSVANDNYKNILNCCYHLFKKSAFDTRIYDFCNSLVSISNCDKVSLYLKECLDEDKTNNEHRICFSFVCEDKVVGTLVIEGFRPGQNNAIINLGKSLIPFLRMAIQNEMMQQKLSRMAYFDSLTGLYNRNSLIEKMKELLCSNDEFGVIFFDVNGLKTVNDEQGHDAGDKLLIKGAETITRICGKEHSYRFGGDEFVVIIEKDNNIFQSVVEAVKNTLGNSSDLSISFGYSWSQDNKDRKDTFVLADKRMYAQKEAFYKKYPELKSLR